jgi:hypothetical protein
VNLLRNNSVADTTKVDTAGHFAKTISLSAGNNRLAVEGFDAAGNKTSVSPETDVFYLTGAFVTIPQPFHTGSQFQVGTTHQAIGVTIELWTLGGDLARVLEDDRALDYYSIPWDGNDSEGRRLNRGPLIALVRTRYADGTLDEVRRAMIFAAEATP